MSTVISIASNMKYLQAQIVTFYTSNFSVAPSGYISYSWVFDDCNPFERDSVLKEVHEVLHSLSEGSYTEAHFNSNNEMVGYTSKDFVG